MGKQGRRKRERGIAKAGGGTMKGQRAILFVAAMATAIACSSPRARGGSAGGWGASRPHEAGRGANLPATLHPLLVRMRLRGGQEEESDERMGRDDGGGGGGGGGGSGPGFIKIAGKGTGELKGFRRAKKRERSSLTYKPGGEMGMGSLRVVDTKVESEDDSYSNITEILAGLGESAMVKLGDTESEEEPQMWRSDWWNQPGVTREDIMKYLRSRDGESNCAGSNPINPPLSPPFHLSFALRCPPKKFETAPADEPFCSSFA